MKIWVMKYALTDGVFVCDGEIDGKMAIVEWRGGLNGKAYFHGRDFQISEEGARTRLREMIESRRKTIKKQLAKLDALEARGALPIVRLDADREAVSEPIPMKVSEKGRRLVAEYGNACDVYPDNYAEVVDSGAALTDYIARLERVAGASAIVWAIARDALAGRLGGGNTGAVQPDSSAHAAVEVLREALAALDAGDAL